MRLATMVAALLLAVPAGAQPRPYTPTSPWNTPIPSWAQVHPNSRALIDSLSSDGFGSYVGGFTFPVNIVDSSTPLVTVTLTGTFSNVVNDATITNTSQPPFQIPVPANVVIAAESDSQVILWNPTTGDEWAFWRFGSDINGYKATNGYHYNTNWDAVGPCCYPAVPAFYARGAGIPLLAGLIRPWEIIQGHIDHAISCVTATPRGAFVCPATKSDGSGSFADIPEGTRIQLDPAFDEEDAQWGLSRSGKIVARAMKTYGLIVTDAGGHSKIHAEYQGSANWSSNSSDLNYWSATLIENKIPRSSFRVINTNACAFFDLPDCP